MAFSPIIGSVCRSWAIALASVSAPGRGESCWAVSCPARVRIFGMVGLPTIRALPVAGALRVSWRT